MDNTFELVWLVMRLVGIYFLIRTIPRQIRSLKTSDTSAEHEIKVILLRGYIATAVLFAVPIIRFLVFLAIGESPEWLDRAAGTANALLAVFIGYQGGRLFNVVFRREA